MYIGKIACAPESSIPKKLIGAWIHGPRKQGQPQSSTKKHFLTTLKTVLPELSKEGKFKEWFKLATDEEAWDDTFNAYLTKLKKYDDTDDETESSEPEI